MVWAACETMNFINMAAKSKESNKLMTDFRRYIPITFIFPRQPRKKTGNQVRGCFAMQKLAGSCSVIVSKRGAMNSQEKVCAIHR